MLTTCLFGKVIGVTSIFNPWGCSLGTGFKMHVAAKHFHMPLVSFISDAFLLEPDDPSQDTSFLGIRRVSAKPAFVSDLEVLAQFLFQPVKLLIDREGYEVIPMDNNMDTTLRVKKRPWGKPSRA